MPIAMADGEVSVISDCARTLRRIVAMSKNGANAKIVSAALMAVDRDAIRTRSRHVCVERAMAITANGTSNSAMYLTRAAATSIGTTHANRRFAHANAAR